MFWTPRLGFFREYDRMCFASVPDLCSSLLPALDNVFRTFSDLCGKFWYPGSPHEDGSRCKLRNYTIRSLQLICGHYSLRGPPLVMSELCAGYRRQLTVFNVSIQLIALRSMLDAA